MIFSGGLWAVRSAISDFLPSNNQDDLISFDRLVLQALALGHESDTFASQFRLILTLLMIDQRLHIMLPYAQSVFDKRELNCHRLTPFTENMDPTFTLPNAKLTSSGISTLPTQLFIEPRASDWKFTLTWRQWANSPFLGPLDVGYGAIKLKLLVSSCPILLREDISNTISGYTNCGGVNQSIEWELAEYNSLNKLGSLTVKLNDTQPKYLLLIHDVPVSLVMYSSNLTFYGFHMIWRVTLAVLGILSICPFLILIYARFMTCVRQKQQCNSSQPNHTNVIKCCSQFTIQDYLLVYMFAIGFMFGLSGVLGFIATQFGKFRDMFTWVMFIFVFPCTVIDIYFGFVYRPRLGSYNGEFRILRFYKPFKDSSLDELLCILSVILSLLAGICIILVKLPWTSMILHAIFYSLYLVFFIIRFCLCIGFVIYWWNISKKIS